MLAIVTVGVLIIGPVIIGLIPVMMVGVLIFVLGLELFLEAVWEPRKKLKVLEYITVRYRFLFVARRKLTCFRSSRLCLSWAFTISSLGSSLALASLLSPSLYIPPEFQLYVPHTLERLQAQPFAVTPPNTDTSAR